MGMLDKIKGWLKIGGLTVKLELPGNSIAKNGHEIVGKVNLASNSKQEVQKLTYKLIQEITTGSGSKKETKNHILGELRVSEVFEIKAGETKVLDFNLGYSIPQTLKDKRGVLGAVGKIGAFAKSEKINYYVTADCDVKGSVTYPGDKVRVVVA